MSAAARRAGPYAIPLHVWTVFDDHTWTCLCGQILSHWRTYGGEERWTWALQSARYGRPEHHQPPVWILRRCEGGVESVEIWRA